MSALAPPYPATTRAKGWRFELDYEQIDQSDTWPIAAEIPMAQHALLMMWFVAWAQMPCGSLPNDETTIRAKCKLPLSVWAQCRDVLMRGWWLASDGRLYHDTLVKRVFEMMTRRRSDSDRQAAKRARPAEESTVTPACVTGVSRGTPAEVTPESSTDNRQPITEEKKEKVTRKRAPSFDASAIELPDWMDRELWCDWVADRRERGKAITERAAGQQLRALDEYRRSGHSPERTIRHAIASGNQGLYPPPRVSPGATPAKSFRERDEESTIARIREMTGGLMHGLPESRKHDQNTIDMEVPHGSVRIIG